MKTLSLIALAAVLTFVGCSAPQQSEAPKSAAAPSGGLGPAGSSGGTATIRHYPVHGKVLAVDTAAKKARIDAGPIGDWMGAMTMNFPIKDDAGFAQLKAGTEIDATCNVDPDDNFWLTDIKVAK
ncbi:MAG TPA: copper-binding protein [Bryobacteraceae bacterium]|nr:copper-binding protein [Bryobacteraceae bacterium]